MKPKEKALQLVEKMFEATFKDNRVYGFDYTLLHHKDRLAKGKKGFDSIVRAKGCAMICVKEIVDALEYHVGVELVKSKTPMTQQTGKFWNEVKLELEKL